MALKRVLFCIEKYLSAAKPEEGMATHPYGIVGTFNSLGLGSSSSFHYDKFFLEHPEEDMDKALVKAVEEFKPDLVLATYILQNGDKNIKPETYGYIRDELKVPVAMMWFESAPDVVRHADLFAQSVTVNIICDTKEAWRAHCQHPEKVAHLLDPRDTTLFNCEEDQVRDIPLSFVGSLFGRMDRTLNIGYLWGSKVNVYATGGLTTGTVPLSIYRNILRRSLITLNFTSAITFNHINARVAEATMCGAMLLQSEDDETPNILEPYIEYVPFKEQFFYFGQGQLGVRTGDLKEKAIYHARTHPELAQTIAAAGRKKAMEKLDGREFWAGVFDAVGVANGG